MESKKYLYDKSIFKSAGDNCLIGDSFEPDMEMIYKIVGLPDDLTDFLLNINGFAFNGIEIFSLTPESLCTDDNLWCVNDIFSFNTRQQNNNISGCSKYLVVGRSDEDVFLYCYEKKIYTINDRTDLMVFYEFDDFVSLFEHVLAERGLPVTFELKQE